MPLIRISNAAVGRQSIGAKCEDRFVDLIKVVKSVAAYEDEEEADDWEVAWATVRALQSGSVS